MLKKLLFCVMLFWYSGLIAQETETLYKTKKIIAAKDTIHLEKVSINSSFFEILNTKNQPIDSAFYKIDFQKGILIFNEKFTSVSDTLIVNYLNYPDFLTKEYTIYDITQPCPILCDMESPVF